MAKEINSFFGEFRFLSNFYPVVVELDGVFYPTIEHAYQAAKTFDQDERLDIQFASSPGRAKHMGKMVTIRPDWEDVKLSVMENLLRQKFSLRSFREPLESTGDRPLIEGNNWGDTFWGVCRGVGQNHLGKLLMKIRREIKDESQ